MSKYAEGCIVEIDVDDPRGHEQRGRSPALVVSVTAFQDALGMALVCPVTIHGGKTRGSRNELEVALPAVWP